MKIVGSLNTSSSLRNIDPSNLDSTSIIQKSPLRYPGGKSRAVKKILPFIPSDTTHLCSPFLGGGSVELACSSLGITVYGYDSFEPLINFWHTLINDKQSMLDVIYRYYPLSKNIFYELQKNYYSNHDNVTMAGVFYILNRSSFSGTTLSGGMSPGHPRFTESSIKTIMDFSINLFNVSTLDFSESIPKHPDMFLYLDPPYANGQILYGIKGDRHRDFDHEHLAFLLRRRDRWLLSYNDCPSIRKLYNGFRFVTIKWTYGMGNVKQSNEVLILSKDISYNG